MWLYSSDNRGNIYDEQEDITGFNRHGFDARAGKTQFHASATAEHMVAMDGSTSPSATACAGETTGNKFEPING